MHVLRVIGTPPIGLLHLRVDDQSPRSIIVTGIGADRDRQRKFAIGLGSAILRR